MWASSPLRHHVRWVCQGGGREERISKEPLFFSQVGVESFSNDFIFAMKLPELATVITSNNIGLVGVDPRICSRLHDRDLVTIVRMEYARDYRIYGNDEE